MFPTSPARHALLLLAAALLLTPPAAAQSNAPVETSACYAFAQNQERPPVRLARFSEGLEEDQVAIRFLGHSTFLIETAKGVQVATDFSGFAGGETPTAVTMNGAHSTHYTDYPDPAIKHVLRGWPTDGVAARHDLTIEDMRIRNVTTDVIRYTDQRWIDGNSIFVFEVADLCIGHLGHLHHPPNPEQYSRIGFLDVVMAPVDGTYTINQKQMIEILTQLRARVMIPMHYFGPSTLARFIAGMQAESDFEIQTAESSTIVISDRTLPRKPTVLVLPPHLSQNYE